MKITLSLLLTVIVSISSYAENTRYRLQVDGLVCPFCAYNIEKNVGKLDGVEEVKANLKDGLVSILVSEGSTLSEDVVRKVITDAGFTLKSMRTISSTNH